MELVKLSEITNNLDNKRVPLNSKQRSEKEENPIYPYIGANNIMGFIDEYIFDEKILCIAEDGGNWGLNEVCAKIYNQKCWVNNHAHVITAKENLILEYLMYYLNYSDLSLHITGATRGKLTKTALSNLKIPLPTLAEQQRIASILDKADALRQLNKQLIEKYTTLSQSLFLEMFGDLKSFEKDNLIKVVNFIDYRGKTPTKTKSGIPLLTAKNIKPGFLSEEPKEYIALEDYKKWMTRGFPDKGDVLFTTEAPLGNACLMPHYEKVSIAQRTICFQCSSYLNNYFLLYVILSKYFKNELRKRATGSTVKGIRSKELSKIKIPLPPLELQNEFAKRIQIIEQQKQHAEIALQKSEDVFNALLQKAFKGEL